MSGVLFPETLPDRSWSEFPADGFDSPVAGVVHLGSNPPVCGMPLGGIDTGCLDFEVTGLLGYSSIFNNHVPRRGPINQPFLGITVGKRTWLLTTVDLRCRRDEVALKPTYYSDSQSHLHNARADILVADEILYWGHYPVADVQFKTSAPVNVSMRIWSPFIPGDAATSNTPGAVFEVRLKNDSDEEQTGTFAFSFPGPNEEEAGTTRFLRQPIDGSLQGIAVTSDNASYVLGVLDEKEKVRCGGELGTSAGDWGNIKKVTPYAKEQSGCCVVVDYVLAPGAEKTVRYVLAWFSPDWKAEGTPARGGNTFTHMYASRFDSAIEVAQFFAANHESLLRRILAWQAVLLCDKKLPVWLRSDLVNYLHLFAEVSFWAQAKEPVGDWCREEDGIFSLNESPRWAPQMECTPCGFYGNQPVVYFFPGLALSTLRAYKAYQFPDGQMPFIFGGKSVATPFCEVTMPARGYSVKSQATLDGPSYVAMVDRLWLRTGDAKIVREFYDSVKANTIFTMNLRPGSGAAGIVSMPEGNDGSDWMEFTDLLGIVPHVGGVHLANLRMAARMANEMGDKEFAAQCEQWFETGRDVMDQHTWAGDYYMLYHEVETGKKSNWIMGCQLDGQWMARSHGHEGVFRPDRLETTLQTLKRTSVAEAAGNGVVVYLPPPDDPIKDGEKFDTGYWMERGVHIPGALMVAMTYMYSGHHEFGVKLAEQVVTAVMEQGWTWDLPVVFDGATRARQGGFDYFQNCMIWSLPAALEGGDFSDPCKPGGLVDRVLKAGQAT